MAQQHHYRGMTIRGPSRRGWYKVIDERRIVIQPRTQSPKEAMALIDRVLTDRPAPA